MPESPLQMYDNLFGTIAIRKGFASSEQVLFCLNLQRNLQKLLAKHFFIGELLLIREAISWAQYRAVMLELEIKLDSSDKLDAPTLLGEIMVDLGYITPTQLLEALNVQMTEQGLYQKQRYLGEILIAKGFITRRHLEKALRIAELRRGERAAAAEAERLSEVPPSPAPPGGPPLGDDDLDSVDDPDAVK